MNDPGGASDPQAASDSEIALRVIIMIIRVVKPLELDSEILVTPLATTTMIPGH